MSQTESDYSLHLFLLRLHLPLYEIIEYMVFSNLIDPAHTSIYKNKIKFLYSQNITVVDICSFLIEFQSEVNKITSTYGYYHNFIELDNHIDYIVHFVRRRDFWEKIDLFYLLKLTDISCNILIILYKYSNTVRFDMYNLIDTYMCKNHFLNMNLNKTDIVIKSACQRCGCSKEFNKYNERVCYCDSCCKLGCWYYNTIEKRNHLCSPNNIELCSLYFMMKIFKKYECNIYNIIEDDILLGYHKISKDELKTLREKKIKIVDICDLIQEYKNFMKMQYFYKCENIGLSTFDYINNLNTIYSIKQLDRYILKKNHLNYNREYELSFFKDCFQNFMSIRSINLFV